MNKSILTSVFLMFILLGCGKQSNTIDMLDKIKKVSNQDVELAMRMHDSLSHIIRSEDTYTQMKYDLLSVRLRDKAYIPAYSDIEIKRLISYFSSNGSNLDKQEVLYYAGSVYRDLQDTPRALDYFLKSTETDSQRGIDSILLRNAYSQLSFLYSNVQDYKQSLDMAEREYQMTCSLSLPTTVPLCHIANAYLRLDSLKEAEAVFDEILKSYSTSKVTKADIPMLQDALCGYYVIGSQERIKACFQILDGILADFNTNWDNLVLGEYYQCIQEVDSAILYLEKAAQEEDLPTRYDALKYLIPLYHQKEDQSKINIYSLNLIKVMDSLDLGHRQELTATIRNEHKYYKDKEEEQRIKEESAEYKILVWIISTSSVIVFLLLLSAYIYRKNKNLQRILTLTKDLESSNTENGNLQKALEKREKEIDVSRNNLEQKEKELCRLNEMLQNSDEELKNKSKELEERLRQNKQIFRLLHQSEFEQRSEDVIRAIRKASEGIHNLTSSEISQFIISVDELYPEFRDKMVQRLVTFSQKQELVCYLMRIGMSNSQIQNLTNLPKATLWRWTKKYGEIFQDEFGSTSHTTHN